MTEQLNIAVLHGPNLDRLGRRRPEKYGHLTLGEIDAQIEQRARQLTARTLPKQSNYEGGLVDFVHEHQDEIHGIVVNPAGLTPYGYSLLDAIRDTDRPFAVVHISPFPAMDGKERRDIFADSAAVYIAGAGHRGYLMALEAVISKLREA